MPNTTEQYSIFDVISVKFGLVTKCVRTPASAQEKTHGVVKFLIFIKMNIRFDGFYNDAILSYIKHVLIVV